ncbi:MAG: DEAD/DEAH box helicase family protein, partial [Pseudomonadota bacterium]|nr:DEAD/DEAH box helicase family protein [Pseudomonadota bacterium]
MTEKGARMDSTRKSEIDARRVIDRKLHAAGWQVQDRNALNLHAGPGVAVREFSLRAGHGFADYLLFVDGQAVGVLEAKKPDHTLSGVEIQTDKYSQGLPDHLDAPVKPLPFLYQSNGEVIRFTNLLDPEPRSRDVFSFHRPATLAEWLAAGPLSAWRDLPAVAEEADGYQGARPSSLCGRLNRMPPVVIPGLWENKVEAITNLERSLRENRPRALIQMATGSGKTLLAVTAVYRLIKFAGARRVLFLVDRGNLGEQAEREFAAYRTPDTNRKFSELYNVQRLTHNKIASSSKVVICTIQRLYSILKGEPELDPAQEEHGADDDDAGVLSREPLPVVYNPAVPPEYFDVVFIDECHRSIYSLWRQVVEYFDAFLIGLTATPAAHTYGFFNGNVVMEYPHERAVADGVNVDYDVYRIRTRITAEGATVEAGPGVVLGRRDRRTRTVRWSAPDEDLSYTAADLDRDVVARDQIRTVVRAFRDRLFTEIFPGRRTVPKTIVFAKDDSHAEDIVGIVREEFGRGNDFCQKVTYRTTGRRPEELLRELRIEPLPRIAVTVDMIATGTDIKPVEIVMFLRAVRSRVLFEQMKGRGVRVIDRESLRKVTPDAEAKTRFVIVDCVGVTEREDMNDTRPLERQRSAPLKKLLDHVAEGGADPDVLSTLASRLARLDRQCGEQERARVREVSGGLGLADLAAAIVAAQDPDRLEAAARTRFGLDSQQAPDEAQLAAVEKALGREAVKPLASRPALRQLIEDLRKRHEQTIDEVSRDAVLEAGFVVPERDRTRELVQSFEAYLAEHRDDIEALRFFYAQPHRRRLRLKDIKALANAIKAPPRSWTPDALWAAYEALD